MNQALATAEWVIQVVLGPLVINEILLQPRQSQTLGFALPKQSYLTFGSLSLTQADISSQNALIAIEHDAGFCRVDSLTNIEEVMSRL